MTGTIESESTMTQNQRTEEDDEEGGSGTCEMFDVDDEGRMVACDQDGSPVRQSSTGMTITACPRHAEELRSETDPTLSRVSLRELLRDLSGLW